MAVVEQKLSKVAHPLYADSDGDATNNCIREYFCMSRLKKEQPAELSSGERLARRSWHHHLGLSSGEATFAGGGASLPVLPPGTHGFAGGGQILALDGRFLWPCRCGHSRHIHAKNRSNPLRSVFCVDPHIFASFQMFSCGRNSRPDILSFCPPVSG